jgi:UDP-N-acetylglucosamine 2-epimerase (non-hydrolysing)
MKILLVAGTRPNFMKIAPLVRALRASNYQDFGVVHTEQHYDSLMSQVFFDELELPAPGHCLNVGSGSHAEQTAKVMVEFERVCLKEKPSIIVVVGDVNSTSACCLVGKKLQMMVAHVEAGLRSGDMTMPEEINRVVTDSISDLLLVSERSGIENLTREGKRPDQIFFVGNVMIDNLYHQLKKLQDSADLTKKKSAEGPYSVVTLHRPSNVDSSITLAEIIGALVEISADMPMVFPVHPRTRKNLEAFRLLRMMEKSNIRLIPPLSYMEFLNLWKDAEMVFTDSGGIQEETTALGVPCFTLRENTERPVTISEGSNVLAGTKKVTILDAYTRHKRNRVEEKRTPELWDGRASDRIVEILLGKL